MKKLNFIYIASIAILLPLIGLLSAAVMTKVSSSFKPNYDFVYLNPGSYDYSLCESVYKYKGNYVVLEDNKTKENIDKCEFRFYKYNVQDNTATLLDITALSTTKLTGVYTSSILYNYQRTDPDGVKFTNNSYEYNLFPFYYPLKSNTYDSKFYNLEKKGFKIPLNLNSNDLFVGFVDKN